MKRYIKMKTAVLIVSYLTALCVILGVFAVGASRSAKEKQRMLQLGYDHAFAELVTALDDMGAALQKSIYATSPEMVNAICSQVAAKAMVAQMSLGELPFSTTELERTTSFIGRTGDYAWAVMRACASGDGYTQEQIDALRELSNTAEILATNMSQMRQEIASGEITLGELQALDESEDELLPSTVGDYMLRMEQEFPELPSLIYDGPFSEHLMTSRAKLLEGRPEVSENEAKAIAAKFMGTQPEKVTLTGQSEGDIPSRYFTFGNTTVAVTNTGGEVLGLLSDAIPSGKGDENKAELTAIRFLESRGYKNMAETYRIVQDGVVTVNFAYKQEGVLCYADLIKVSVAMDTCSVCGFEARGYIMNHAERELGEVAISEEEAVSMAPQGLNVLGVQTVLIPTEGEREILCRELKCENEEGRHYLIYLDAATGKQVKILILIEDETGALTI